jgi:adenine-specific DNA-methyltransferase
LYTPRRDSEDVVSLLARRHGLALASLFRADAPTDRGSHAVLLDGPLGSFAVSTDVEVDPTRASSWVWSANLPHHVLIGRDSVHVTRWDQPSASVAWKRQHLEREPDEFFDYLRRDRVQDPRNVVAHAMDLFRRVRTAVEHADLPDQCAMTAYLTLLAATATGSPTDPDFDRIGQAYALPDDYREIVRRLSPQTVEATLEHFSGLQVADQTLRAYPALAMRHASGAIFQEAHYTLLTGTGEPDLFGVVAPARAQTVSRGVVHFTPPSLARGLSEQALGQLDDLHERPELLIADITCGSGAFLIECLRTLERLDYKGRITVYGRDLSPAAVDMARFVLGLAAAEWPGPQRSRIDIGVQDTLRETLDVRPDVIVMNPPFMAWPSQDAADRETLRAVLGSAWAGRPDISTGFVLRAVEALQPNGVLAALLPASTLETEAGSRWRDRLRERHPVALVARFDNLSIFSHATVRLGAIVLGGRPKEALEVRSGPSPEAVGDVLRALRRGEREDDSDAAASVAWTIRPGATSLRLAPGLPTRGEAWWNGPHTVPVNALFEVKQGIRTGYNQAFVFSQAEVQGLPPEEQAAFRAAITSEDIIGGRAPTRVMIFYPYGPPWDEMADEADLMARLPVFAARQLLHRRETLQGRARATARWWNLSLPRGALTRGRPIFVTKYFAGPGGIALDAERANLVLQGFGWIPTERATAMFGQAWGRTVPASVFAYLAILNSNAFFEIVAAHSNTTRGGQFDMSQRYVDDLPLIDLAQVPPEQQPIVADLATLGRAIHVGETATLPPGAVTAAEAGIKALYRGHVLPTEPVTAGDAVMPAWLARFIEAEKNPDGRKQRVAVLVDLRQRAKAGAFVEIDNALRQVDPSELNDYALSTLLRGTFAMRLHLPFWTAFRDRAADVFRERGRDLNAVMIGLNR